MGEKLRLRQVWSRWGLVWMYGLAIVLIVLIPISAIPRSVVTVIIGRLTGPIQLGSLILLPYLAFTLVVFLGVVVSIVSLLISKKMAKGGIKLTRLNIIVSLVISVLVVSLFSFVFILQTSQYGRKIDAFVAENANLSFQDYVDNVSSFLNGNVRNAYNSPEVVFKVDVLTSVWLLDPYMMQISGVTRSDVILYQGWGTCEQGAIVIQELLRRDGYQTRLGRLVGIDHEWAEVKYNGTWLVVDPWYITQNGTLIQAKDLKSFDDFKSASGVQVQYPGGTWINASSEYGY